MKPTLLLFLLIFGRYALPAQQVSFAWAKQAGGTGTDIGFAICVDLLGNSYVTGQFSGTADMDPGPAVYNLISAGSQDVFVAKYDPSGNLVWARQCSGAATDIGTSIAVDNTGNTYIAGAFFGTTDFDPGPGVFSLTATSLYNVFVVKLDAGGNLAWAKQMGGDGEGRPSVALDNAGNVFITEGFSGSFDFDPGAGSYFMSSRGFTDIFLVKLNNAGGFLWARQMGGRNYDNSWGIDADPAGNVYLTGDFSDTADFDPGPGSFNCISNGDYDAFICKIDGTGGLVWVRQMGGIDVDQGISVAIDPTGNVYVTGGFRQSAFYGPGTGPVNVGSAGITDIFILKLTTAGNLSWLKRFGGPEDDISFFIDTDAAGNAYLTGIFADSADFDPGPCVRYPRSIGVQDIFIACLSAAGNLGWMKQMGGTADDAGYGIALAGNGSIFSTGYFSATADMDPGPAQLNFLSRGSGDIYLHRMDRCPNPTNASLSVFSCTTFSLGCQTFSSSGINTVYLVNAAGCDSIITLNLTIGNSGTTTNLSAVACRNYTWQSQTYTSSGVYRDTLTGANGCDSILVLQLNINQPTSSVLNPVICPGQQFAGYTSAGTYRDTLIAANGCDSIRTIQLSVQPGPAPNLGPDKTICPGDTLQLNPGVYDTYTWSTGSTNSSVTVNQTGVYTVTVTNTCGIAFDEIRVTASPCQVRFPSGFTPNSDGKNELFRLAGAVSLAEYRLQVYNRWGEKVFETTDPLKGWNGTYRGAEQPTGVFAWYCRYRETASTEAVERKGTVLLIR